MLSTGVGRPENLTGTHGEPALHARPTLVNIVAGTHSSIYEPHPVELFITSESLLLYCEALSTTVAIHYPDITLHATSSEPPSLYLQIENSDLGRELLAPSAWAEGMFELTLKPIVHDTSVGELFSALSTCAAMHPDPDPDTTDGHDDMALFADPNHEWITADTIQGQFDDADLPTNGDTEQSRKWRRTD